MKPIFAFVTVLLLLSACQTDNRKTNPTLWQLADISFEEPNLEEEFLMYSVIPGVGEDYFVVFNHSSLEHADTNFTQGGTKPSLRDYGIANASSVGSKLITVSHGFENVQSIPYEKVGNDLILIDTLSTKNLRFSSRSLFASKVRDSVDIVIEGIQPRNTGEMRKVIIEGMAYRYSMDEVEVEGEVKYLQEGQELYMLLGKDYPLGGLSGAVAYDSATKQVIGCYSGRTLWIMESEDKISRDTFALARIALAK